MDASKPTLLDLPAAALACFALHLDRPQDRAILGACCRYLHSHSKGWWASLQIEVHTRERAALLTSWLAQARPAVTSLQLEFGSDGDALEAFALPSPPLPSLANLAIKSPHHPPGQQLLRSIPQQRQLLSLSLGGCGLRALPPAFGRQLPALRVLDLCRNRCMTALGLEPLEGLGALETLSLDHCGLTELPAALSTLTALRTLTLRWNRELSGGLAHLEPLCMLTWLDLRMCGLMAEGMAPLRALACLQRLGLSSNLRLAAGLEHLAGLAQLTSLYISGCKFRVLPAALGTLSALQRLDASGNLQLAGGLEHLAGLGRLSSLRLGGCGMEELPVGFSTLTALQKLELNGSKQLTGGWRHLAGLQGLTYLDLRGCATGGQLPAELAHLAAAVRL